VKKFFLKILGDGTRLLVVILMTLVFLVWFAVINMQLFGYLQPVIECSRVGNHFSGLFDVSKDGGFCTLAAVLWIVVLCTAIAAVLWIVVLCIAIAAVLWIVVLCTAIAAVLWIVVLCIAIAAVLWIVVLLQ